jgi:serine/threonine-protein kinase RsbW
MADTLKIMVPGKAEYVGTIRLAVSSIANRIGFDIEAIEDIKVAVSEACSNIVCHSNIREEYLYQVVCVVDEEKLEISVEDEGAGFDLQDYEEPVLEDPKESGLGVFIIRALMDEVSVRSELGAGTHIKMVKYVKPDR